MKRRNPSVGVCAGFLMPHPPIIIPDVGKGKEQVANATITACTQAARDAAGLGCDTIVLFSPHAPLYRDYVYVYGGNELTGSLASFGAPETRYVFPSDVEFQDTLIALLEGASIPAGTNPVQELDHGALVPLHFIREAFSIPVCIVVVASAAFSSEKQYLIGTLVQKAALALNRRVCIIASGDMSHKVNSESPYGAVPAGAAFDRKILAALESSDCASLLGIDAELREKAAECGYGSIVIMCGAFDGIPLETHLLNYEAPFGIGYCVASFLPGKTTGSASKLKDRSDEAKDRSDLRVRIARLTIEQCIQHRRMTSLAELDSLCDGPEDIAVLQTLLHETAGVFVSLKKAGDLRGCIGTIAPTAANVAEEIIRNAVHASTMDPRFDPVRVDELSLLVLSVDVLGTPEPIASQNDLDPARWGVIVSAHGRRGLLLPDLEGVDTIDEQLSIACRKGGIDMSKAFLIERFLVTRYR